MPETHLISETQELETLNDLEFMRARKFHPYPTVPTTVQHYFYKMRLSLDHSGSE